MKYLLFLLPIVLISLCTQLPELSFLQEPETITTDAGSPDLFIKVETVSSEIKAGRDVQIYFELRNKQSYDLRNVYFEIYDYPCIRDDEEFIIPDCANGGTLKANQSCVWFSRWKTKGSDIDKQCSIKFLTSYEATNSIFQDIAVLPEAEYLQREIEGTLRDIPIQTTSAKGPLNIYLTFSEPQPFMANQTGYNMYINYYNKGKGFFGDLTGKIKISPPDNIDLSCDKGGPKYGNDLVLDDELKFIKGRAVKTICNFNTKPASTINIRSLSLTTNYKYILYNSIPITVKA